MVTWNVATRHPEEDLNQMLGFGVMGKAKIQEKLPDFYVIGFVNLYFLFFPVFDSVNNKLPENLIEYSVFKVI